MRLTAGSRRRRRHPAIPCLFFFLLRSLFERRGEAAAVQPQTLLPSRRAYPRYCHRPLVSQPKHPLLLLRGGGNLAVRKDHVAQLATWISFVQGLFAWLDPGRTCRFYGMEPLAVQELLMKLVGILLLQFGLGGWVLFCSTRNGSDLSHFFGVSLLTNCVAGIQSLATSKGSIIHPSWYHAFLISNAASFVAVMKRYRVDIVWTMHILWYLGTGFIWILKPGTMIHILNGSFTSDLASLKMARGYGFWLLSLGVFWSGLSLQVSPVLALAYSRFVIFWRTLLIHFVFHHASDVVRKKQIPWLIYHAVSTSLLFYGKGN